MTTARGMVATTRRVLGDADDGAPISQLGHGKADSLLRKLCAACHLGRDREAHTLTTLPQGGGCLACHLDDFPQSGHVRLTSRISDARCFGCHARSGRIALNYAGLAETDQAGPGADQAHARLADGRLVQRRESDAHHKAGMACIDCHGQAEVMGYADGHAVAADAGAIECVDCHRPLQQQKIAKQPAQTKPSLPHVQLTESGASLIRKLDGKRLAIPPFSLAQHPHNAQHQRLSCDACHAQWAPLCYGCHVTFDASAQQYDYLEQAPTAGAWRERRWQTRSGLPPLGVTADDRISPFIPGMILTLDHPELDETLFRRLFAPQSPHTTGPARSCQSCHCDPQALGLGAGSLEQTGTGWRFQPAAPPLEDGLPADAWHSLENAGQGDSSQQGARPLNAAEIERILGAGVDCDGMPAR